MRLVKILLIVVCGAIAASAAALAGMIAFGTGAPPKPLASIGDPFKAVDFGALPALEQTPARHGSPIAFRHWDAASPRTPGSRSCLPALRSWARLRPRPPRSRAGPAAEPHH